MADSLPPELWTRIFRITCLAFVDWSPDRPSFSRATYENLDISAARLFTAARFLACVCRQWKRLIYSDNLLQVVTVNADKFEDLIAESKKHVLDGIKADTGVQLVVGDRATEPSDEPVNKSALSALEKTAHKLQSLTVISKRWSTSEAVFRSLESLHFPRLNALGYCHAAHSAIFPVPVPHMRAPYLNQIGFRYVRVDPTHIESWTGVCEFFSNLPNLTYLSLSKFHPVVGAIHSYTKLTSSETANASPQSLQLPSLSVLTLQETSTYCLQILLSTILTNLDVLAIDADQPGQYFMAPNTSRPLNQEPQMPRLRKCIIHFHGFNTYLLPVIFMPTLTDVAIGLNERHSHLFNWLLPAPPQEIYPIQDEEVARFLKLLSNSPSGTSLKSLTLNITTDKTGETILAGVNPDTLTGITTLTLSGPSLTGTAVDDISLHLPNVEKLRLYLPGQGRLAIRYFSLGLYYDAAKQIHLLPKLKQLSVFVEDVPSFRPTANRTRRARDRDTAPFLLFEVDLGKLGKYLRGRVNMDGFTHIQRLELSAGITESVRTILESIVDVVVDCVPAERL